MPKASTFPLRLATQMIASDTFPMLTNAGENVRLPVSEARSLVGPGWSDTVNAYNEDEATDELKVQAAISRAVSIGATRVFIPSSMTPYDSSLITFNTAIQMVWEGGSFDTYDIRAYGANGGGSVDDRNTIAQADASALIAESGIYVPPGVYSVQSNLTITSPIHFSPGAILSIPTGITITLNGHLSTGIYKIFECAGTGNVGFAVGSINEIYPEWWGALGDGSADDYAPIAAAIVASLSTVVQITPTNGQITASITPIVFTRKHYKISQCPSTSAYQVFRSPSRSIIEQTTALKAIIQFGDCVHVYCEGIQFVGGRCAIWFWNTGENGSKLTVRDCSFQLATEVAIQAGGSSTGWTTLAATTTGYTRASGSFLDDGFVVGMGIKPEGFAANTVGTITAVDALTMTTGARGAEGAASDRRLLGGRNNDTLNTNVTIDNCEFFANRSIAQNRTEFFEMKGMCWVQCDDTNTPVGSAQFENFHGKMVLRGMFGVPDVTGANHRWVDNYSRIHIYDSRLGGENGGIGGVWHRIPPLATSSNALGSAIVIKGCAISTGGTVPKGLVQIWEGIPELLDIDDCTDLGTSSVIVANQGSLVLATEFASYGASVYDRFRWRISPNLMSSPVAIPSEILPFLRRRFDQIMVDPDATLNGGGGTRALADNTAAELLVITLDPAGGNDDDMTIDLTYRCWVAAGSTHSVEIGRVTFAASRGGSGNAIGNATKFGSTQAMVGGLTMTITFTVVIATNVATLKVTNDTSDGSGSDIKFYASQRGPTRAGTTVALGSGVTYV